MLAGAERVHVLQCAAVCVHRQMAAGGASKGNGPTN